MLPASGRCCYGAQVEVRLRHADSIQQLADKMAAEAEAAVLASEAAAAAETSRHDALAASLEEVAAEVEAEAAAAERKGEELDAKLREAAGPAAQALEVRATPAGREGRAFGTWRAVRWTLGTDGLLLESCWKGMSTVCTLQLRKNKT